MFGSRRKILRTLFPLVAVALCGASAEPPKDRYPLRLQPEDVRMFLFENNPTGKTIGMGANWRRVFVNNTCIEFGSPEKLLNMKPFSDYGLNSHAVMSEMLRTTVSGVNEWQAEAIPKEFRASGGGPHGHCRDKSGDRKLFPDKPPLFFGEREHRFYTDPALFSERRRALPRHGGLHIVKTDDRCLVHIELFPDNNIKAAETTVLLDGKHVSELTDRATVMCFLRATFAQMGLTGMLTYPEKDFIYNFETRMSEYGDIALPFWKLHPYVALRYKMPAGQTWPSVKRAVVEDLRRGSNKERR